MSFIPKTAPPSVGKRGKGAPGCHRLYVTMGPWTWFLNAASLLNIFEFENYNFWLTNGQFPHKKQPKYKVKTSTSFLTMFEVKLFYIPRWLIFNHKTYQVTNMVIDGKKRCYHCMRMRKYLCMLFDPNMLLIYWCHIRHFCSLKYRMLGHSVRNIEKNTFF